MDSIREVRDSSNQIKTGRMDTFQRRGQGVGGRERINGVAPRGKVYLCRSIIRFHARTSVRYSWENRSLLGNLKSLECWSMKCCYVVICIDLSVLYT